MRKQYLIYGAGELGKNTYRCLKQNNLSVKAFIDKRAVGDIDNIPILRLESNLLSIGERHHDIVIICLNAGTEHKKVADELYLNGYERIVFLPIEYTLGYEEKIRLTNLYNRALGGQDVEDEVKSYKEYVKMELKENAVIRYDKEYILSWINQEILFSEDKLRWKGDRAKVHYVNGGIDVNLNVYYWVHDLFDALDGKQEGCQSYLSIYEIASNSERAISKLKDRQELVLYMNKMLARGVDFFVEAAPNVIWNHKGYFNIIGGNHRTIFLQHKGYVFYPVRMVEKDYFIWKNEECLQDVLEYIESNGIENTYVPIPHPNFMDFPYLRESWGNTVLGDILRYFGAVRLEGKNVIDVSQYEGYFARMTKRMCADKVQFYSCNDKTLGLAERLFKLLHLESIGLIDGEETLKRECNNADIIFGMLNTEELVAKNYLQGFSGKLFTEFCVEDDKFVVTVLENTKMNRYTMLHREVFQGKMLEVGVFEV